MLQRIDKSEWVAKQKQLLGLERDAEREEVAQALASLTAAVRCLSHDVFDILLLPTTTVHAAAKSCILTHDCRNVRRREFLFCPWKSQT